MTLPGQFYASRKTELLSALARIRKMALVISLLRLLSFLGIAFSIYNLFAGVTATKVLLLILLVVLFLGLVRFYANLAARRRLLSNLVEINNNEIAFLGGRPNMFRDGSDIPARGLHADDLDLFGGNSLFHVLNRTSTFEGHAALAAALNAPQTDISTITAYQNAVRQLSTQPVAGQMITAQGRLAGEVAESLSSVANWIMMPAELRSHRWLAVVRVVLPLISLSGLYIFLDNGNPILLGVGVLLCWLVTGKYSKTIMQQHLLTARKQQQLEQQAGILKAFLDVDPGESERLSLLRNTANEAHHAIYRLSRLTALLDQRMNLLVNLFLNSLLLYDVQCMFALEKWKDKNRSEFPKWTSACGDIELINSLATFAFNRPGYIYPQFRTGKPYIAAAQMGHPLIAAGEQVTNDVTIGGSEKIMLITGSNMSGKSTFLRTIGVNVLLAQAGAPVCAHHFSFTPLRILSSIRISDSLQDHTSYFMAELKRLRALIQELESGDACLVLIDEVLRGTNSDDKTFGSEGLIKKLLRYNCVCLFATHDLALSMLETKFPDEVSNYCFESTISEGELSFDYKLRRGVATNRNASFLMQKMGII